MEFNHNHLIFPLTLLNVTIGIMVVERKILRNKLRETDCFMDFLLA